EAQPKIPAAAATIEGVEMLERMQARGEHPQLRLTMGAHFLPDAESANVVAEIKGREKPEEVVVIGGHIDSWDVGQGAQDDVDGTHYFDIHHTQADTFDKVNPQEFASCVAALAVMAYVVADMPERL